MLLLIGRFFLATNLTCPLVIDNKKPRNTRLNKYKYFINLSRLIKPL